MLYCLKICLGLYQKINNSRNLLYGENLVTISPIIEIELPSGSCMLFNKSFFQSIGSFDPNTFLYCEEDILYAKIKKLCKKII